MASYTWFFIQETKGSPAKADPVKQEEWIGSYNALMDSLPARDVVEFGDGVHPTISTKLSYGWIRTGKNKLIETTGSRTRMNLMGSINLKSMELSIAEFKTIDSEAMKQHFLLLRSKYKTVNKIHLILDQGSYNTSEKTKKFAEEQGIILHYLPTYSPNLNPFERLWKVMNEYCRKNKYFATAKEFRETIMHFFNDTWPKIACYMSSRINDNFQILKSTI